MMEHTGFWLHYISVHKGDVIYPGGTQAPEDLISSIWIDVRRQPYTKHKDGSETSEAIIASSTLFYLSLIDMESIRKMIEVLQYVMPVRQPNDPARLPK
jgi:hypothetical protein